MAQARQPTAKALAQNHPRGLRQPDQGSDEPSRLIVGLVRLIGTVYGMNFQHMPELGWTLGYPLALLVMVLTSVVLYVVFKRIKWL